MSITDEDASLLEPAEMGPQGKAGALLSRASAGGTGRQGTSGNVLLEPLLRGRSPGSRTFEQPGGIAHRLLRPPNRDTNQGRSLC